MYLIENTIQGVNVQELLTWAGESIDGISAEQPLCLPPVQRTAVWGPWHILNLWDSLFRGMPIGLFYVIPAMVGHRTQDGKGSGANGATGSL